MKFRLINLSIALLLLAGCAREPGGDAPAIAVSSSYIECAVRDLLGPQTAVMRLAEPGMCPGHFDLRPSQVRTLRQCRVLLRFEFQDALDRQVNGIPSLAIAPLTLRGGMCEPESYLDACEQTAAALVSAELLTPDRAAERLADIRRRLDNEALAMRERLAPLRGAAVITSARQAGFCRWLGLNVIATIGGADGESIRRVDQAIAAAKQSGCTLVIANRPEGTQLAEAIAERLGGKLVVFDNFPDLGERQGDFDGLLRDNVQRLLAAVSP